MLVHWFFFFKLKTAYEMRISDWSSDVCSSDLDGKRHPPILRTYIVDRAEDRAQPLAIGERVGETEAVFIPVQQRLHGACIRFRGEVRSEDRRVGKAWVSNSITQWSTTH